MKQFQFLKVFVFFLLASTFSWSQPYDFQFRSIVNDSTLGYNRIKTSYGLATDRQGKIYVTSFNTHDILIYTTDGVNFTSCGKYGSKGTGNGQFDSPSDIAIDSIGRVYVCDRGNSRIQVFSITGSSLTFLTKFGTNGTADDQFKYPNGIGTDGKGKIYVTDLNFYEVKVLTMSGSNLGYYTKFQNTSTTVSAAGIPNDVAINKNGEIFVGSYNYIQVFTASGTNYTEIVRTGGDGLAAYKFRGAYRLAFNSLGNLIIGENQNQRIQAYRYISANRQFDYIQIQYWLTQSLSINAVYGLDVDFKNRILITSNSNGIPHSISMFTLTGNNLPPLAHGFNDELGQVNSGSPLAFDNKRNLLYHASPGSYYFNTYSVTGQSIIPFAKGIGMNTTTNLGFYPVDVQVDTLGNVYVLNGSGLQIYTLTGKSFTKVAQFASTAGDYMQIDPGSGAIYVQDIFGSKLSKFRWDGSNLVREFKITNNSIFGAFHIDKQGRFYGQSSNSINSPLYIWTIDGSNFGFFMQMPSPPSNSGQIFRPKTVNSDDQGLIYVSDWGNGNIYVYSVSGTNYTHIQTNSLTGNSFPKLSIIEGIHVSKKGQVFIVDGNTNKIVSYQRVNSSIVTSTEPKPLDQSTNSFVRAYPNPTKGNILFVDGVPAGSTVIWSDAMGKTLFTKEYSAQGLDIGAYSPGIYLLTVKSEQGIQSIKVIVD